MRNKNLNLFFVFLLIIVLSVSFLLTGLSPVFASKSEVILPGLGGNPTLPQYISAIFNFALQIAGGLALLAILLGSLRYITSFGSPGAKNEGKQWVKSGILGLILLFSSYLILYTINKNLVSLEISPLGMPLPVINIPWEPGKKPAPSEMTYNEFPMGTLTENVLSRTTDCYEFDLNGDQIDAKTSTTDIYEPGLTNHDRIDCALKIYEAAEKKAEISSLLSEEIAKLMETCKCDGNCDQNCSTCNWKGGACPQDKSAIGTTAPCSGDCIGALCKKNPKTNTCDPDIKKKIGEGPIKIGICPECGEKTYKGLEEFRPLRTEISSFVEIEKEIDGKKVKVIREDNWNQLKLIEQLMYFKEKINKIKEELKIDSDALKQAEDKLNQCYLAKSSVDFLKITEGNDKIRNGEIIIQKIFKDPITNQDINPSKYCKGYNYSDSSCFGFCQKMCFPTANPDSIERLKSCDADNFDCLKNGFYKCANNSGFENMDDCIKGCRADCSNSCDTKYPKCLVDRNKECKDICAIPAANCSKFCDTKYPTNPDKSKECKAICAIKPSSKCPGYCDTKYPKCKDENKQCKDACSEDSKYILEQDEKCFGTKFRAAKNCADFYNISDFEGFKRCVESSMCSFCTDQYAGYPDCAKNIGESSSLYLYQNSSQQKCQSCYQVVDQKTGKIKYEGVEQYPECQKCPLCSICPKCPCKDDKCTKIEEKVLFCGADCMDFAYNGDPLTFYCWTKWWEEAESETKETGTSNEEIINEVMTSEDITGEEKQELIKEEILTTPILAETFYCLKGEEIPIGETVDGTEKWADELIKFITDNVIKKLDNMIEYVKQIGNEKNYCECDSKCDGKEGACQSNCVYGQMLLVDPETGLPFWFCFCDKTPCQGNPCQKMINLLRGKKKEDKCPKDIEYKGVAWYAQEIKKVLEEFKKNIGGRSDLLKKLVYSRKKMEECSIISSIFEKERKTISCTIMKDYIIDPISRWNVIINNKNYKNQCYGGWLGKLLGASAPTGGLMDNWECCEKRTKTEPIEVPVILP